MYPDLIVDDHSDSLVGSIGINEEVVYKKEPPSECYECGCNRMNGVEILGASDLILFWECEGGDKLYLARNRTFAEKELVYRPVASNLVSKSSKSKYFLRTAVFVKLFLNSY